MDCGTNTHAGAGNSNARTARPWRALSTTSASWGTSVTEKDWTFTQLRQLVEVRSSSVDKKSEPDEVQVRLCNYNDVYGNDYITSGMEFMEATATDAEISR